MATQRTANPCKGVRFPPRPPFEFELDFLSGIALVSHLTRAGTMIADTQRQMMVDGQIRTNEVSEPALLEALYSVPREQYVPENAQAIAYSDKEILVAGGHALLTPMVLAKLIQALELSSGNKVLDIGGATGYGAALMTHMGAKVVRLEDAAFAQSGSDNVQFIAGDLAKGDAALAPFDAILINGAVDSVPADLLAQLGQGGRLVAVVGRGRSGKAVIYSRNGAAYSSRNLFDASAPALAAFAKPAEFVF